MRNHRKIKALRNKFGLEGYAIFNMFLETLTECDEFKIRLEKNIDWELLSADFGTDKLKLIDVLTYCVDIELLLLDDKWYFSESLIERLSPLVEKREHFRNKYRNTVVSDAEMPVSDAEMPQTKLNKTKLNISKDITYDENFKTTYKDKSKIYKQLGKEYKPTKKTSAQEKSIAGMKLLDYFRDKAMELHRINYLSRPEDKNKQMVKKAIECFERFETKEKCLELVDWYLSGYGEWNKYEPTTCFMSKTYQAFENKDVEVKKKVDMSILR